MELGKQHAGHFCRYLCFALTGAESMKGLHFRLSSKGCNFQSYRILMRIGPGTPSNTPSHITSAPIPLSFNPPHRLLRPFDLDFCARSGTRGRGSQLLWRCLHQYRRVEFRSSRTLRCAVRARIVRGRPVEHPRMSPPL